MNLARYIRKRAKLAAVYAEDGAMHTAASILQEAATAVKERAKQDDEFIAALLAARELEPASDDSADPINLHGSGPVPISPKNGVA